MLHIDGKKVECKGSSTQCNRMLHFNNIHLQAGSNRYFSINSGLENAENAQNIVILCPVIQKIEHGVRHQVEDEKQM
jgi:hypothetical protein